MLKVHMYFQQNLIKFYNGRHHQNLNTGLTNVCRKTSI